MISRILDLPVFLIFVILACAGDVYSGDPRVDPRAFHVARSFFYSATLGLILCALDRDCFVGAAHA